MSLCFKSMFEYEFFLVKNVKFFLRTSNEGPYMASSKPFSSCNLSCIFYSWVCYFTGAHHILFPSLGQMPSICNELVIIN